MIVPVTVEPAAAEKCAGVYERLLHPLNGALRGEETWRLFEPHWPHDVSSVYSERVPLGI